MPYRVAHSVRGRLRVRYPSAWLRGRQEMVESGLRSLAGVTGVAGNPATGSVRIEYDPFALAQSALFAQLDRLSGITDRRPPARRRLRPAADPSRRRAGPARGRVGVSRDPVLRLAGATATLAASLLPVPPAVVGGLLLITELPALRRALSALGRRRLNGDVLEAATLALLTGRASFTAGALLSWLRSLGDYIVATTVVRTRRSFHELVTPPDEKVPRVTNGRHHPVPVTTLTPGDVVVVTARQRLPVDGTVVRGEALMNEQTMTGEPLPVERRAGDRVFAATVVEHGEIEVRVDRVGLDTAVGKIIRGMEAASEEKSDIQVFAERLADREVGRTLVLAGLGAAFSRSVDAGTAILVADYGMAARVGVPTALVTSLRRAAQHGILIKGPRALESLARVDTVAFDKTGTLTLGTPAVGRVVSCDRTLDEDDIVRLAAAAERRFEHPVARAIARLAAERAIEVPEYTAATGQVGLGIDARVDGVSLLVGSRRFMTARGVDLDAAADDEARAHQTGASVTFVAIEGRLVGLLILEDQLRADARQAVQALRARRMRNVILLSGDHAEPTHVIAETLGLRHHHGDLLPEDKARLIRSLRREGRVVAMIGDGVNDALALSEADVGLAVPGGAPVAAEAADVVLLRGGLDRVVQALDLARDAIGGVRKTMGIAARANMAVVALASLGVARPVASILLSHGATVAAAVLTAVRPELLTGESPGPRAAADARPRGGGGRRR